MKLNHQDYRLLVKLKKQRLNRILKKLDYFQFKPFLNFLETGRDHLFDQMDMSKSEFYMYSDTFVRSWLYDYLQGRFNKEDYNIYEEYTKKRGMTGFELPDKETIENLYNHFLDIYKTRSPASLYKAIMPFISIAGEIPEELLKSYLQNSDAYSNIKAELVKLFIEYKTQPPEDIIELAAKDDIKYNRTRGSTEEKLMDLIDQYNDSSMQYSEENEIAKHTLRMYRFIKSELESEQTPTNESFKSFFYK